MFIRFSLLFGYLTACLIASSHAAEVAWQIDNSSIARSAFATFNQELATAASSTATLPALPVGFSDLVRGQSSAKAEGGEDLASQVVDPTAAITQLTFQDKWVSSFHNHDASEESFVFRPAIPFEFFGLNQILRTTINYRAYGPKGEGLDSVQIFDLFVFQEDWGRWGIGPLVSFSPSTGPGSDTFQIGPAAGFTTQKGAWTFGFFNQNLLSEDVAFSSFQPIIARTFSKKISVSLGDIQLGYDWKTDQWVSLPLGFQVNYIATIAGDNVRLFYNPQYNFRDLTGLPEWTHTFGFSLLLP